MTEIMQNTILCSTGTLIGRANGFDYRIIAELKSAVLADGFELMMVSPWYGQLPEIAASLRKADIVPPVIHFEKDIGPLLSLGTGQDREEGLRLFRLNAEMGCAVGAKKAVFHLWDGRFSEQCLAEALLLLDTLSEICAENGLELLIENIPCRVRSPYAILSEIAKRHPQARFIFDTRHAHFMGELEAYLASELFRTRTAHLHISDYSGETVVGKWGVTRPILQPGEGIIDFRTVFAAMPFYTGGTVTLESPVLGADGVPDLQKLNRSLTYLSKNIKK